MQKTIFTIVMSIGLFASMAQTSEPVSWYWVSAGYGTPVITNSSFYEGGYLEIKVGARLIPQGLTLVGGLENTLRPTIFIPERFSPFLGPGYMFKDKRIFFSIHTGVSYPFYKQAPDYPKSVGMHNALDLGLRLVRNVTLGMGFTNHWAENINANALRFWLQLNMD